jgi:hypothetical protein
MKKGKYLILLTMFSLGLVACGGGGPTDTSNFRPGVLFVETWEDYPVGSFPGGGWKELPETYFKKEIQIHDDHKMFLNGPSVSSSGHGGIAYYFKKGTMKPTYIHYKIHPYATDPHTEGHEYSSIGSFSITGYVDETNLYTTDSIGINTRFYQFEPGLGTIAANRFQTPNPPNNLIQIDHAFRFELKNIDWDSSPNITFDLWINGVEVETCIPFLSPIQSITGIYIYNHDYGRIHIDDIFMADLPVDYHCPVVSEDPPGPDNIPLPPAEPPEPVLFIFEMPSFCRGGPSTEYPKLSTYPEGAELEINGQNIEGSWWWSEEGGCWVSDSVGELVGEKITLEIIIPPPPPAEEDAVDKEKGKTNSCKANLGKDACIEAGGTWDDQPGQPGTCVCP